MRLGDALKLSLGNIREHKKRSLSIVLMIGLLFGLLMGFNLVLDGLEKTLLEVSTEITAGKSYVTTNYYRAISGENQETRLTKRLEKYNGKKVGELTYYNLDGSLCVISASAVKEFVTADLSDLPAGKVPVLVPETEENIQQIVNENGEENVSTTNIEERYVVVGKYPVMREVESDIIAEASTSDMIFDYSPNSLAIEPKSNPLNLALGQIYNNTGRSICLVDDGSGRVQKSLDEKIQLWRDRRIEQELEYQNYLATLPEEERGELEDREQIIADLSTVQPDTRTSTVAVFDNVFDLKDYANHSDTPEAKNFEGRPFGVSSLFSNTTDIASTFLSIRIFMKGLIVVLLIIAVIISVLTFAHLVDSDAATVALYRSMGATTTNIYLIYFLYLLELCIFAVLCSLVIAFSLTGIMALFSGPALAEKLQESYLLDSLPKISLIGFDSNFLIVIVAILLVAPLALGFTTHRFSAEHVARKLKDD